MRSAPSRTSCPTPADLRKRSPLIDMVMVSNALCGSKPGSYSLELHEWAPRTQQRGSDDSESTASAHLRYDPHQWSAELAAAKADAGAAAALVERGNKVWVRRTDRRYEAEENPGEEPRCRGVVRAGRLGSRLAHAASGFADSREIPRADGQEQTDSDESENEAEKAAGQREGQALGKQLADDLEATERRARRGSRARASYRGAHFSTRDSRR